MMRISITILIILAAAAPFADATAFEGPRDPAFLERAPSTIPSAQPQRMIVPDDYHVLWSQDPTQAGLESQVSEVPVEIVMVIDDFVAPSDEAVTLIRWWGCVFPEYGPGPVDHFQVTFFHSGGCTGPDGDLIFEQSITTWDEVEFDDVLQEYTATIGPVALQAGEAYWVSIQAVMDFDPYGIWGWAAGLPALCPSMVRAPIPFGIDDWTPVYPDVVPDADWLVGFAFYMYADGAVAVDRTTWSTVKELFR